MMDPSTKGNGHGTCNVYLDLYMLNKGHCTRARLKRMSSEPVHKWVYLTTVRAGDVSGVSKF